LESENTLINFEHSIEHALEREVNAKRISIDRIFFLLELVLEVTPIPVVDLRVRIFGLRGLQLAQLRYFGVELRLDADDEIVDERLRCRAALCHLDFGLEIIPRFVAELQRGLVAT